MIEFLPEEMTTHIRRLNAQYLTGTEVNSLNAILNEFSGRAKLLSHEEWQGLAKDAYVAVVQTMRHGIVGMATLVTFRIPTGAVGLIEDVAVYSTMRGRGFGTMLVRDLIREARMRGVKQIDLTSRPNRLEANELYRKLGFNLRHTNCYRLEF